MGLSAILLNRLSERIGIPAPAFFLVAAAVAARMFPDLYLTDHLSVERAVSVALIVILFDGGAHIGLRRFRRVAGPVALLGILGTFLTTAGVAAFAHYAFGFDWYVSVLLGAAIAPTDPAVVFAVLGRREISGPSGAVLEGESGANDPVGIALMSALIAAGGLSTSAVGEAAVEFTVQMTVGLAAGILGGRALLWFVRAVALPNEGLYPLRMLAGAFMIFGLTTVAQGSGFLAVFVAGILVGDARVPYRRETKRFLGALAGLGEIVAFVLLGLTIDLDTLARADVWGPGLVLGGFTAVVIRPVLVGLCTKPMAMTTGEKIFVLWAGLKGAVPILLGSLLLSTGLPESERLYGIVVVVVVFSVVVQGSTVSLAARVLRIGMRTVALTPYSLGVRLRTDSTDAHRVTITDGSIADGITVAALPGIGRHFWLNLVVREGSLLSLREDSVLRAGDEVSILAAAPEWPQVHALFTERAGWLDES